MDDRINPLRRARLEQGWTQTQLIAAIKRVAAAQGVALPPVESLKTNVRRWENDHVTPAVDYRRVLRGVYGCTDAELGLPAVDESDPMVSAPLTYALSPEGMRYYDKLLAEHIAADNAIGPACVLPLVEHQARQLSVMCRSARDGHRSAVLIRSLRFHEFLGWLQQDTGRYSAAMASTDHARDLATELRDAVWDSYLLMRKSNIATDAADPCVGAALAEAAFSAVRNPPHRLVATILRQKANAAALMGDSRSCAAAIEDAFDAITSVPADEVDPAPYCTDAFIAMEAAACWTRLAAPRRALDVLQRPKASWPDQSRRDKGLHLARTAAVYVGIGDDQQGLAAGRQALAIARQTRSARTIAELKQLRRVLRGTSDGAAVEFSRQIASLSAAI